MQENVDMTPTPARRFPWIVLAYLGPLAVLPLIIVPLSPRLRDLRTELSWHAWQGFLLAIIETVVLVGVTALAAYATLSSVPAGVTSAFRLPWRRRVIGTRTVTVVLMPPPAHRGRGPARTDHPPAAVRRHRRR